MSRLTPKRGIVKYFGASYPDHILGYDHASMYEEVKDFTTGLVGAMIKLRLPSLSAPEMGSALPLLATYVPGDIIRIMIDPIFSPYKEKGQDHMLITALAYTGEMMILDTSELDYLPWEDLVKELQYQQKLFDALTVPPA